jgi:hypothetical protein
LPALLKSQNGTGNAKFISGLVDDLKYLGLETGDLLLFQSKTFNGIMTQIGTLSPYTHCALVIRNPDGSFWLTHSTDNDYYGSRIPVINEPNGRSGVVLTKLEDLFISTDGGETGFYTHIWIRKFDETWIKRPSEKLLFALYEKHKKHPFTKSKLRFILAALDFKLFEKDLLSLKNDETYFCSEYIHMLLEEAGIPVTDDQNGNEYTPKDIRNLEPYYDSKPIVFKFENGMYRIK